MGVNLAIHSQAGSRNGPEDAQFDAPGDLDMRQHRQRRVEPLDDHPHIGPRVRRGDQHEALAGVEMRADRADAMHVGTAQAEGDAAQKIVLDVQPDLPQIETDLAKFKRVYKIAKSSRRIARVYFYEWAKKRGNRWDSAFLETNGKGERALGEGYRRHIVITTEEGSGTAASRVRPTSRPPAAHTTSRRALGSGRTFTATCTTAPSVPRDPVASRWRS